MNVMYKNEKLSFYGYSFMAANFVKVRRNRKAVHSSHTS